MDKYYYFISQLSTLFFAKETDLTIEHFLDEAQKWLSAKDYSILSKVDINDFSVERKCHHIFQIYKNFESQMRTDIAQWREAQRRNLDYKLVSFPVSVIKEGNPLEVEIKLMELRWQFIDEKEREHHFDLGFIILYFLKLQILRRYFIFNKEQGLKKFETLYEVAI